MYVKKKIFLFLLIGGVTVIQAQKNEKFTPPEMTQKTHTFALPELQIDSTFITNLNAVIFENGEIPLNIILKTKTQKRFSYKDPIPAFYDPPFWTLIYHTQTGNIEFKGNDCDCY